MLHRVLIVAMSMCFSTSFLAAQESLQTVNAVDPDGDSDGESNYVDYCPRTPAGARVWHYAAFQEGRAQRNWVGCAGGADVAAPGYTPPSRPANTTMYDRINGMVPASTTPDPIPEDANAIIYIGRCYTQSEPSTAIAAAIVMKRGSLNDGPLGEDITLIASIWSRREAPDFYDNKPASYFLSEKFNFSAANLNAQGHWQLKDSVISKSGTYLLERIQNTSCYYYKTIVDTRQEPTPAQSGD